jgi:hypothetical protein
MSTGFPSGPTAYDMARRRFFDRVRAATATTAPVARSTNRAVCSEALRVLAPLPPLPPAPAAGMADRLVLLSRLLPAFEPLLAPPYVHPSRHTTSARRFVAHRRLQTAAVNPCDDGRMESGQRSEAECQKPQPPVGTGRRSRAITCITIWLWARAAAARSRVVVGVQFERERGRSASSAHISSSRNEEAEADEDEDSRASSTQNK